MFYNILDAGSDPPTFTDVDMVTKFGDSNLLLMTLKSSDGGVYQCVTSTPDVGQLVTEVILKVQSKAT